MTPKHSLDTTGEWHVIRKGPYWYIRYGEHMTVWKDKRAWHYGKVGKFSQREYSDRFTAWHAAKQLARRNKGRAILHRINGGIAKSFFAKGERI